jgi:hypothetical protein
MFINFQGKSEWERMQQAKGYLFAGIQEASRHSNYVVQTILTELKKLV